MRPSGFSSGEGMLLKSSAWMNTENERIVSEALVIQKPVNEMLHTKKSSSNCYCIIVFLLTLLLAQNFCHPAFLMSTKEGRSFSKRWKTVQQETVGMCHGSLRD